LIEGSATFTMATVENDHELRSDDESQRAPAPLALRENIH